MLALAAFPSPLALIFLVTLAPLALILSSIGLLIQGERSIYHRIALWSGFIYPLLLALCVLVGIYS